MGRICWCPICIVMKGQKKAEDFQSRSLIWSWLDRGFELSGPARKKPSGKTCWYENTYQPSVCTSTEQFMLRVLLSNSHWRVLWSWPCYLVFLSVHFSQRLILIWHLPHYDLPPSFILNLYVFTSNALLRSLHNLIFTPFSKGSRYFSLCFSLSLLFVSWTCYLHDDIKSASSTL